MHRIMHKKIPLGVIHALNILISKCIKPLNFNFPTMTINYITAIAASIPICLLIGEDRLEQ